jgi:hypothetical protein
VRRGWPYPHVASASMLHDGDDPSQPLAAPG